MSDSRVFFASPGYIGSEKSDRICSQLLEQMRIRYRGHPGRLITPINPSRYRCVNPCDPTEDEIKNVVSNLESESFTTSYKTLEGLSIKTEDILEIVKVKPAKIAILFGVHPCALNLPIDQQFFTTAFVGLDDDQNVIASAIFDFCDPYP